MEYDYLKVKEYSYHKEKDLDNKIYYILSFNNSLHIRVSEKAKGLLDKFDGKHTLKSIVNELSYEQNTVKESELIEYIKNVLIKNYLLEGYEVDTKNLKKRNPNRISIHIPIIESKRFNILYKLLNLLFNKYFVVLMVTLVLLILSFILYEAFKRGGIGSDFNNLNSGLIIICEYISLLMHEFGHITAAYRYGISAGKIGVGIYLIYPVFYVDLTNAWRIDNKKRMIIDLGGIYLQVITCIPLYLMYCFIHNETYLVAAIIIAATTFVNLVPVLKLDGYWFLSDCLRLSNISVKPFESIKVLILKSINKTNINEKCTNSEKVKGIYSLVYVISTAVIMTYGVIFSVSLFTNYSSIISRFKYFLYSLSTGEISRALILFNNLFILILPIIFILCTIIKMIIITGIKGFMKNRKVK
ncbi:MAG: hypothetical protein E7214_09890 [Clostridium sp.]|nr:hypothetical protein [Clostridium sp.]